MSLAIGYFANTPDERADGVDGELELGAESEEDAGGNCIKIGLPGKLILSKKGLWEVLFS